MYTSDQLAQTYGSTENIPNSVLYEFLCQEDTRAELARRIAPYKDRLREAAEAEDENSRAQYIKLANAELEKFKESKFVASVRKRCKSDLGWLACWWTWETNPEGEGRPISDNRVTEESHGPIINLFVKKDDTKKLRDQDTRKLRLLLWPRNGMKSTLDVVDSVQWILNFPEIRILYLTGDNDLAQGFVKETKGHFLIRTENPSLMNLFFPEFCFEEKDVGNVYEFNNPVWLARKVYRKEPTVQAASVGSGLGGRHYEVVKADDAIYDRNTENEEICVKVARKISVTVNPGKALRQWGYLDAVGTRYHDDDWYGHIIEKNIGELKVTQGKCWTLTENPTTGQLILIGKAIVIKPEVVAKLEKEGRPVNYIEAGEEGCDLLLPDIMPYKFLMGAYADNEEVFEGQLNQNPRSAGSTTFDRPLLLRNTVPFTDMPYRGPVSITWDFAGPFNKKKGRDHCTASVAMWNEKGTCYITELIRSRFRPADLAKAVVDLTKKYHPFIVGIEDAGGARWLEDSINSEARKSNDPYVMQICSKIDWIPASNVKGAKLLRIASLHPWFVDGRMKLANYLLNGQMELVYSEFERCLHGTGHDDVPDCISYQLRYAPRVAGMIVPKEGMKGASTNPFNPFAMSPEQAAYNLLYVEGTDQFGRVGFGPPPTPIIAPEPEPEVRAESPGDLPPILGAGLFG